MSICKQCGATVKWIKRDRWYCENADGSDHWDLCSKLKTERIKRTGEYFEDGDDKGYATKFKKSGIHWIEQHSLTIVGENYHPGLGCQSCVPPWEVCPNNCPNEMRS